MTNNIENCPHFNTELQGEIIPKEQQELYSATHFSRKIGSYDLGKDRTIKWVCSDCNGEWDR